MITKVEDYFTKGCGRCPRFDTADCSTKHWAKGIATLRQLCLDAGLVETIKWGHPCYMYGDRNIALIGAFRGNFRLNFMNAALLRDPDKVLEKQGDNSSTASMICLTDATIAAPLQAIISAYLQEAIGYVNAGVMAPKRASELILPDEFVTVLDQDPVLSEGFHALTPGRQRSYVIALTTTQNSATRAARIAKYRDKIMAGKGATER